MMKKTFAIVAVAVGLCTAASAAEPIKVGLLNIDGGPFAIISKYFADGATFAIDSLNAQGGALGRKYELVIEQHAGTPASASAAATRLASQDGVSFFTGLNTSSMTSAITPKLAEMNALLIDSSTSADSLTSKGCSANYFRTSVDDGNYMNANRVAIKESGVKTWDVLAADYATGHDFSEKISALIKEQGGTVQKTLFAPLNTTDFGSYISDLGGKPAEGLAIMFPGSGAIALAKQQQQYGLFGKYKNVLSQFLTNDSLINAQADTTVRLWTWQEYHWQMPGEQNAAFVKAFEARYKRKPTYIDGDMYITYQVLNAAIQKAGSTDMAAVRAALAGLKTTTIAGEVEMRAADHQLLRPMVSVQATEAGEGKAVITLREVLPAAKVATEVSPECKMQ